MKWNFYKVGIAGLALGLGLLSSFPAYAVVCGLSGGSIFPNPSGTCAEVSATVSDGTVFSQGNPIPFNYGFSPGSGTVSVIIAGTGVDASASVTAEIGTLHLFATSSDLGSNPNSFAGARASAAFADTGTVTLPGATFGTLVHAVVTVAIDGSHDSNAGFGPDTPHLNVGSFINTDFPNGTHSFDTTVGAVIPLSLGLEIFADSSSFDRNSTADYSNTAQLFFDFAEAGAFFNADSGHNYSSSAIGSSTPVPAALPLFATGLGALGLLGWRKKKAGGARRVIKH